MSGSAGQWQTVYDTPDDKLQRLPVEGGWLYRNFVDLRVQSGGADQWAVVLTFVPDDPRVGSRE